MWQYSANYTGVNDSAKMTKKKMKKTVQEPRTAVSVKTMRQAPPWVLDFGPSTCGAGDMISLRYLRLPAPVTLLVKVPLVLPD